MSALPDTTRLLLATARALHAAGYRRPYPASTSLAGGRIRSALAQLDTTHHLEFEPAPRSIPGQARLIIRHGAQQIVWDGVCDASDAVTLLARLGVIGTCRQCDLPIEPDAVECEACSVTTDLIAYDAAVDHADYGRHSAHEAA
jgi:hypothetical protein